MRLHSNFLFTIFITILSFSLSAQIIYVSPSGSGDGSRNNPASIEDAFSTLSSASAHIRLGIGTYNIDNKLEILHDNMVVEGGFEWQNNWVKTSDALATIIHRSDQNVEGTNQSMRLVALSMVGISGAKVQNLKIEVDDAFTTPTFGISTYGVYMRNSLNYTFTRVYVEAGAASSGADGATGENGIDGGEGNFPASYSTGGTGANASLSPFTPQGTGGNGGDETDPSDVEVLDANVNTHGFFVGSADFWQSFTPTKTGLLSKFSVHMDHKSNQVRIKVFVGEGTSGSPVYSELHTVSNNNTYADEMFLLRDKINVQSGQKYTLEVEQTNVGSNDNNPYSGGRSNGVLNDLRFATYIMGEAESGYDGADSQSLNFNSLYVLNASQAANGGGPDLNTWQSFIADASGDMVRFDAYRLNSGSLDATLSVYKGAGTGGTLLYQKVYNDGEIGLEKQFLFDQVVEIIANEMYTVSLTGGFPWRHTALANNQLPNGGSYDHAFKVWTGYGIGRMGGPGGGGGGRTDNTDLAAGANGGAGTHVLSPSNPGGIGGYPYAINALQSDRNGNNGNPGNSGNPGLPGSSGNFNDFYEVGDLGSRGSFGYGGVGGSGGGGGVDLSGSVALYPGSGGGSGGEGGGGGYAGYNGGASFGFYISNDNGGGQLIDCYVDLATAGSGGAGGAGGIGGSGGAGGTSNGPFNSSNIHYSGSGGTGGTGGNGGSGASGINGVAMAIHHDGFGLVENQTTELAVFSQPEIRVEEPISTFIPYTYESSVSGNWDLDNDGNNDIGNASRLNFHFDQDGFHTPKFSGQEYTDFLYFTETNSCPNSSIIYVDQNASGNDNGESWTNAYTNLSKAISIAHACGIIEIYVAKGTYFPERMMRLSSTDYLSFYIYEEVTIYGGFNGTENHHSERSISSDNIMDPNFTTVLSGDILENDSDPNNDGVIESFADIVDTGFGDNVLHVVVIDSVDESLVLDGLTITAGNATGNSAGDLNAFNQSGGGLYIDGTKKATNPRIHKTTFIGNRSALYGGAVSNFGNTDVYFENCHFLSNQGTYGGGLSIVSSSSIINDGPNVPYSAFSEAFKCRFQGNFSPTDASVLYADNSGGEVANFDWINNLVTGNSSPTGSVITAIAPNSITPSRILNSTVANHDGSAIVSIDYEVNIENSIFHKNGPIGNSQFIGTASANFNLRNSIISGPLPGLGEEINIINADPLFIDSVAGAPNFPHLLGNYSLNICSPAINHGLNSYLSTSYADSTDILQLERYNFGPLEETPEPNADLGPYEYQNPITFTATKDSTDAYVELAWSVPVIDTLCDCFTEDPDELGGVDVILRVGSTEIYTANLSKENLNAIYSGSFIHNVGPDSSAIYNLEFRRVGPGTLNCIAKEEGNTIPFIQPEISYTSINEQPDSVKISWINKSYLTDGFSIYRDNENLGSLSAVNTIDATYGYDDVFSFVGSSFENGDTDNYCIETNSNLYQGIYGIKIPEQVCQDASSYVINLLATEDAFVDKVVLTWNSLEAFADEIHIKRDGELIAVLPKSAISYEDFNPIHGQIMNYELFMVKNGLEKVKVSAQGSTPVNGVIEGKVVSGAQKFPLPNIPITIMYTDTNAQVVVLSTNTDFIGQFSFDSLYYGLTRDYVLSVDNANAQYAPSEIDITLTLDQFRVDDIVILSDSVFVIDTMALSVVSSFSTNGEPADDRVKVEWSHNKNGADTTYFNVFRGSTLIHQSNNANDAPGPNSNFFYDLDGVPDVEYNYSIQAFQLSDSTSMQIESQIDTFPAVAPVQVFTADGNNLAIAEMAWTHSSQNFEGFKLYRLFQGEELIYEGDDLSYFDSEGVPDSLTQYFIRSFRIVDDVTYESVALDTLDVMIVSLLPFNSLTIFPLSNQDEVKLTFDVPAQYVPEYNYNGVNIVRTHNGEDVKLISLDKELLPASSTIVYYDKTGHPDFVYDYEIRPFLINKGIEYEKVSSSVQTTFPSVSLPTNLGVTSFEGRLNFNWDSPHSSDNYNGFAIYKELDSIGQIPYQLQNSFNHFVSNPSVTNAADYSVRTKRTVDGISYLSDPIVINGGPPLPGKSSDEPAIGAIQDFEASDDLHANIKLCWKWTISSNTNERFILKRNGTLIDTLPNSYRSFYDNDAPVGEEVFYSLETSNQKVFTTGMIPTKRSIAGRVYKTESFKGIVDANVKLKANDSHQYLTTTDSTGYYKFTNLPERTIVSQFSGIIEGNDPVIARPNVFEQGQTCPTSNRQTYYDVVNFRVSKADTYVFDGVMSSGDTYGVLYNGPINNHNGCQNAIAGDDDSAGELDPRIFINLVPGVTYTWLNTTFASFDTTGNWAVNITSVNGGEVYTEVEYEAEVVEGNHQFIENPKAITVSVSDTNTVFTINFEDSLTNDVILDEVSEIEYVNAHSDPENVVIDISWSPVNSNYDGFEVYRGTELIGNVAKGNPLLWSDGGGVPGIIANYYIRAYLLAPGGSTYSDYKGGAAIFPDLLPVENLTLTEDVFQNVMKLKWTHRYNSHVDYSVTRNGILIDIVDTDEILMTIDSTGIPGQTYTYEVIARTEEYKSIPVSIGGEFTQIKSISSFDISSPIDDQGNSVNHVLLEWNYRDLAADTFIILRRDTLANNDEVEIVGQLSGDARSFMDFTGEPGIRYLYEVLPGNIAEGIAYYAIRRPIVWYEAMTYPSLSPFYDLTVTSNTENGIVELGVLYKYQGIEGYQLIRNTDTILVQADSSFSLTEYKDVFKDVSGQPNANYTYKGRAFSNRNGTRYYSAMEDSTLMYPTTPSPINFIASNGVHSNKIELTWEYKKDIPVDNFEIHRKLPNQSFNFLTTVTSGERTFDDISNFNNASTMYEAIEYQIKAINQSVSSNWVMDEGYLYDGRLVSESLSSFDNLGQDVSIDGDWAVAGSDGTGFAIYHLNEDGVWKLSESHGIGSILTDLQNVSDTIEIGEAFGAEVSLSGSHIVVSATLDDGGQGSIYTFKRNNSNEWVYQGKVKHQNPQGEFDFGTQLQVSEVSGVARLVALSRFVGTNHVVFYSLYTFNNGWVFDKELSGYSIESATDDGLANDLLSLDGTNAVFVKVNKNVSSGTESVFTRIYQNNGIWDRGSTSILPSIHVSSISQDDLDFTFGLAEDDIVRFGYMSATNAINLHPENTHFLSENGITLYGNALSMKSGNLVIGKGAVNHVKTAYESPGNSGTLYSNYEYSADIWDDVVDYSVSFGQAVSISDDYYMVGSPNFNTGDGKVNFYPIKTELLPPTNVQAQDNLTFINNTTALKIDWTASTDPNVTGYEVYRDGNPINAAISNDEIFDNVGIGLIPGKIHSYTVRAKSNDNRYSRAAGDMGNMQKNGKVSGTIKTAVGSANVIGATVLLSGMVDGDYVEYLGTTGNDGVYEIDDIYFGLETEFKLTAQYFDHEIVDQLNLDSAFVDVTLNVNSFENTNANMLDVSAYSILGQVQHKDITGCSMDSIKVTRITDVNGTRNESTTFTDEDGMYSFVISPNTPNLDTILIVVDEYRIIGTDTLFFDFVPVTPSTFVQTDHPQNHPYITSFNNIDRSTTIDFRDQIEYLTKIKVETPCGEELSPNSIWTLRVSSIDGCFEKLVQMNADNTIDVLLPPKDLQFTIIDVDDKSVTNLVYLDFLVNNPGRKDLYELHRDTARYLNPSELAEELTIRLEYHKPAQIVTDIFGNFDFLCGDQSRGILAVSDSIYDINFNVVEQFSPVCTISSGYLVIVNPGAMNTSPVTVQYDDVNMSFPYRFTAGLPNPIIPHAWNLKVEYYSDSGIFQGALSQPLLVQGSVSLPGSGIQVDPSSKTDNIPTPLFVLIDPPGDKSFAQITTGNSVTRKIKYDKKIGGSLGGFVDFKVLVAGVGAGNEYSTTTGLYDESSRELSITTDITETISTRSGSGQAASDVGRNASIIVGAGIAMKYGLVSSISLPDGCTIEESLTVGFSPTELKTTWSHTVGYIENEIQEITRDIGRIQRGKMMLKDEDGKDIPIGDAVKQFQLQKRNWEKVLDYYDNQANPISYLVNTDFKNLDRTKDKLYGTAANRWKTALLNTVPELASGILTQQVLNDNQLLRYNNAMTAIRELMNASYVNDESALETKADGGWKFQFPDFIDDDFAPKTMAETVSFSGLVNNEKNYEVSKSLETSSSFEINTSIKNNIFFATDIELKSFIGLGGGVINKVLKNETKAGISINVAASNTETFGNNTQTKTSMLYSLSDGDENDNLTVNVLTGLNLSQTPYFQVVGGETSCPHEEGTLTRNDPVIQVQDPDPESTAVGKTANLFFQDPSTPATFTIIVGHKSAVEDTNDVEVFIDNSSNPNGATVKVAGNVLGVEPFQIVHKDSVLLLTLTVEAGQSFDYSGLRIGVRPACTGGNISDYITLNVKFQSPCSPVSIVKPDNNWLINGVSRDLIVGLRDYVPSTPNFEGITLEYRQLGAGSTGFVSGWDRIPFSSIKETDIDNNPVLPYTLDTFNINNFGPGTVPTYFMVWEPDQGNASLFPDGEYEIRAVSACKEGSIQTFTHSNVVPGFIDRARLQLFGEPQPSDGVWIPGDLIAATFNKDLNCNVFNDQNFVDNYLSAMVADTLVHNATFTCYNNEIRMTVPDMTIYDGEVMTVSIDSITDPNGNFAYDLDGISREISWDFLVATSKAYWEEDSIVVEVYEGEQVTVNAGLRNTQFMVPLNGLNINRSTSSAPWLGIAPENNFDINPSAVKSIGLTFEGLTEGVYYDTLSVSGATLGNGIVPMLPVKFITKKRPPYPPDWEIDGNLYPSNMTLVANYQFGPAGTLSTDTMDQITVWLNDSQRGLGRIVEVSPDQYVSYITVYGSSSDDSTALEFRIWDASEDIEYDARAEQDSVYFIENSYVGSTADPRKLIIDTLIDKARYITLNQGYTWLSFNSNIEDMSIVNIMGTVDSLSPGDRILGQQGFIEYVNDTIGWLADSLVVMDTFSTEEGYLVYLQNGPDSIRISGSDAVPFANKEIKKGTNWVGFPSQVDLTVEDGIGVNDLSKVLQLRSQTEARLSDGTNWLPGALTHMMPNQGYKLLLSSNEVVAIPGNPAGNFKGSGDPPTLNRMMDPTPGNPGSWNIDLEDYAFTDVIPVVGEMLLGGQQIAASSQKQIAAFIGDSLRGVSTINSLTRLSQDYFTLLIGKDDGETEVKLYYADGGIVKDSVTLLINDLLSSGENGIYNYLNPYQWDLCADHLILGLEDSPLMGIYQASQTITINGAVQVMPGISIELSAPIVELDDMINIGVGANVVVKPDGCN